MTTTCSYYVFESIRDKPSGVGPARDASRLDTRLMTVACGYYWKKISDASTTADDGASSSLSGSNNDGLVTDNTPLV